MQLQKSASSRAASQTMQRIFQYVAAFEMLRVRTRNRVSPAAYLAALDVVSTLTALLELLLTKLTPSIGTQSHKTGYTTPCLRLQAAYLSASDVVSALTALLELPLKPGDEATPRDRFWCAT